MAKVPLFESLLDLEEKENPLPLVEELREGIPAGMLPCLAPYLMAKGRTLVRFVVERPVGRPWSTDPFPTDGPWAELLRAHSTEGIVQSLQAGAFSTAEQEWLADLMDPTTRTPLRLVPAKRPGGQRDAEGIGWRYDVGQRIQDLRDQGELMKNVVVDLMQELGVSRKYLYECLDLFRRIRAADREF